MAQEEEDQIVMVDQFDYDIPSKVFNGLYLSSIKAATQKALRARRFTAVLSVLSEDELVHVRGIEYHLVKLDDDEEADLFSHLEETTQLLDKWLNQEGRTVLVHCQMGVS